MCFGLEPMTLAAIGGGTAAVVSSYEGQRQAKSARNAAADEAKRAQADRLKAETEAAQRASGQTQMARRALAKNSLFTGAGTAGGASGGQTTLGVG